MRVNIFNNILALKPKTTELDKIVQMMCFSQELCDRTQVCMRHAKWGHKMKVKDMKRKRFPAFAPCAVMNGGKAREDVMELTDLCYLDFDNIKEEEKLVKAMQVLRNDKNVVMASRSVSGFGLHILIRYKLMGQDIPKRSDEMTIEKMQEIYALVYGHLVLKYYIELGLLADMQAGHMEHLYIVSFDPFMYYNPAADPLMIDLDDTLSFDFCLSLITDANEKIVEVKNLVLANRVDDAEQLAQKCRQNLICLVPYIAEKQEIRNHIALFDDFLVRITLIKEKIKKAYEILTKVEDYLANNNFEAAFENIAESNRALHGISKPYKVMLEKVRKDILETSQKVVAANRVIKMETQRQKFLLRGLVKQGDYKQAILYIIEKLEAIQKSYDAGNLIECKEFLMIINAGLGLLPGNDNKAVLEAHYEKWKQLVNDAKNDAVS